MSFKTIKWKYFRILCLFKNNSIIKFFLQTAAVFIWLWELLNSRWLKKPIPNIILTLFAGALFAIWWEGRLSSGTANFKYEKPVVKIVRNKNKKYAPTEIDYSVQIIVQNKTNTAFDIGTSFVWQLLGFTDKFKMNLLTDEDLKKMKKRDQDIYKWTVVTKGMPMDFKPQEDGFGKLEPHDYFKMMQEIKILPPKKLKKEDFDAEIETFPEKMLINSYLKIKFPDDKEIVEPEFLDFKNPIIREWLTLTVPGYENFDQTK